MVKPVGSTCGSVAERLTRSAYRDMSTPLVNGVHCLCSTLATRSGYPRIGIASGKMRTASRVAYQEANKVVLTSAEHVCHDCDNKKCIEPLHLFLGDNLINVADKMRKGRQLKGVQIGLSKLTPEQALEIFRDPRSHRVLAKIFDLGPSTVAAIKTGRSWSHVTGAAHAR